MNNKHPLGISLQPISNELRGMRAHTHTLILFHSVKKLVLSADVHLKAHQLIRSGDFSNCQSVRLHLVVHSCGLIAFMLLSDLQTVLFWTITEQSCYSVTVLSHFSSS